MEPEPAAEHAVVESEVSLIDRVENVSARILDDCDTNQIETEIKKIIYYNYMDCKVIVDILEMLENMI